VRGRGRTSFSLLDHLASQWWPLSRNWAGACPSTPCPRSTPGTPNCRTPPTGSTHSPRNSKRWIIMWPQYYYLIINTRNVTQHKNLIVFILIFFLSSMPYHNSRNWFSYLYIISAASNRVDFPELRVNRFLYSFNFCT
jgi:hypothetical protein